MEDVTSRNILKIIETLSNIEKNESLNFKPPIFNGEGDIIHFIFKLDNFLDLNKITGEQQKIQILTYCLSDSALDLYLSLEDTTKNDFDAIKGKLSRYFSPKAHDIIELQDFMKMAKEKGQTVLDFYVQVKKKGLQIHATQELIKIVLIQGQNEDYQKYIVMQKANTVEDVLEAALEFEKIEKITDKKKAKNKAYSCKNVDSENTCNNTNYNHQRNSGEYGYQQRNFNHQNNYKNSNNFYNDGYKNNNNFKNFNRGQFKNWVDRRNAEPCRGRGDFTNNGTNNRNDEFCYFMENINKVYDRWDDRYEDRYFFQNFDVQTYVQTYENCQNSGDRFQGCYQNTSQNMTAGENLEISQEIIPDPICTPRDKTFQEEFQTEAQTMVGDISS